MNYLYRDPAFPDRRGHPLNRAMTYITHREHSWHTALEQIGRPWQRRFSFRLANSGEIRAGENVALLITSDARW